MTGLSRGPHGVDVRLDLDHADSIRAIPTSAVPAEHEAVMPRGSGAPVVDVVVPVLDEAHVLARSIRTLHHQLSTAFPFTWRITIADNGSTDGTAEVAGELAAELGRIRVLHLDRRGRGLALRTAWTSSDATVLAYMDVDLSTGLDALLPLVAPLVSGHSDVAIGSRFAAGSSVARGPRREAMSRAYNLILRTAFATRFRDAQCGFKAVRADVAAALLPQIGDDAWFFDTELLLLAEHNGLRVHEVAVDWTDDPDSRVDVVRTALDDLRGVARMALRFASGAGVIEDPLLRRRGPADDLGRQLVPFVAIGTVSTSVSLALFLGLRAPLGAVAANALAISVTAVGNAWANRRYTLDRRGAAGRRRHYAEGLVLFVGGAAASTAALVSVHELGGGSVAELGAVLATWSSTAATRFALLRRADTAPPPGSSGRDPS